MDTINYAKTRQVLRLLAKNGLAAKLNELGFSHYLSFTQRFSKNTQHSSYKKLTQTLEQLGGVYSKFLELVATRVDLFPALFVLEARVAKTVGTSVNEQAIINQIQTSLQKPINEIFDNFDPRPLNVGLFSQIHKARLHNGTAVAVKVLKPRVHAKANQDLRVIHTIAQQLEKKAKLNVSALLIVAEFESYLKQELDLRFEAHNLKKLQKTNKTKEIVLPKLYSNLTSKQILTLDYIEGEQIHKTKNAQKLSNALTKTLINQIFEHGDFHSNLCSENILQTSNNKLAILDFGHVTFAQKHTQKLSASLFLAIFNQNYDQISEILLEYGQIGAQTNVYRFNSECREFLEELSINLPKNKRVTHIMQLLYKFASNQHITFPRSTMLIAKALENCENSVKLIDSTFEFDKQVAIKIKKYTKLPSRQQIPKKLEQISLKNQQRTNYHTDQTNQNKTSKQILQQVKISSKRVSLALIAAALIVGGALFANLGPKVAKFSVASIFSLTFAAIFVGVLFLSIIKE